MPRCDKLQFPAKLIHAIINTQEGDKILEYLFTKWEIPITHGLLEIAVGNSSTGRSILRLCFDRHPDLRASEGVVNSAIWSSKNENLQLLLEQDSEALVGEAQLEKLVSRNTKVEMLKTIYDAKGERLAIPIKTFELAIRYDRAEMVYWMFEVYSGMEITESVLCAAAGSQNHSTALAKYFFDRCDRSLILSAVLHEAVKRWNSADKMTALVFQYAPGLAVSDELLLAAASNWNGKIPDILLEQQPRQEVPTKLVDDAIRAFKGMLSWNHLTWKHLSKTEIHHNSLLETLKRHVPNDPYLQKMPAETDFTVPTDE